MSVPCLCPLGFLYKAKLYRRPFSWAYLFKYFLLSFISTWKICFASLYPHLFIITLHCKSHKDLFSFTLESQWLLYCKTQRHTMLSKYLLDYWIKYERVILFLAHNKSEIHTYSVPVISSSWYIAVVD